MRTIGDATKKFPHAERSRRTHGPTCEAQACCEAGNDGGSRCCLLRLPSERGELGMPRGNFLMLSEVEARTGRHARPRLAVRRERCLIEVVRSSTSLRMRRIGDATKKIS